MVDKRENGESKPMPKAFKGGDEVYRKKRYKEASGSKKKWKMEIR